MKIHDTHAHLDLLLQKLELIDQDREIDFNNPNIDEDYSYPKQELIKLLENHEFVIQAGISTKNFLLSQKLFGDIRKIKFTIGSHPELINDEFILGNYLNEQEELLEDFIPNKEIIRRNGIIGIGEVGLDYFYNNDAENVQKQKELFESQIELAIKLNLPLIIHIRDAFRDTFKILEKYPQIHGKFVVHCFTGRTDHLKKILDFGGVVGYTGIVTFKNALELQETVKICPNDRFIIETDLPFLAPMPNRGKTCLPEYVDFTAEKIAKLKNLPYKEVWKHSLKNSERMFF